MSGWTIEFMASNPLWTQRKLIEAKLVDPHTVELSHPLFPHPEFHDEFSSMVTPSAEFQTMRARVWNQALQNRFKPDQVVRTRFRFSSRIKSVYELTKKGGTSMKKGKGYLKGFIDFATHLWYGRKKNPLTNAMEEIEIKTTVNIVHFTVTAVPSDEDDLIVPPKNQDDEEEDVGL